jgi:hypothetical protein
VGVWECAVCCLLHVLPEGFCGLGSRKVRLAHVKAIRNASKDVGRQLINTRLKMRLARGGMMTAGGTIGRQA